MSKVPNLTALILNQLYVHSLRQSVVMITVIYSLLQIVTPGKSIENLMTRGEMKINELESKCY